MKIAFVAPFFGAQAAGGAEAECRQTAIRLAARGVTVDILTTCLLDVAHDWNTEYHRAGVTVEDGLTVRRFRPEPAVEPTFSHLNQRLLAGGTLSPTEQEWLLASFVNSFDLYRWLASEGPGYDRVCFIPYLFSTSVHGSRFCGPNSVLIPCLHDEGYARLTAVRAMFERVGQIVFHTASEQALAATLYGPAVAAKGILLGEGVDIGFRADGGRFRRKYGLNGPLLLYAGRKDHTKNVHTLISYFAQYREQRRATARLVLVGPGTPPIPAGWGEAMVDLGFVPDQDKKDAYAAATVFVQPSLNESFSIVLMEAWLCGVPALVHGGCAVMRDHVVRSGGGLYFEHYGEFEGTLDRLLADKPLRRRMGGAGAAYVREHFGWDHIIDRYMTEVLGAGSDARSAEGGTYRPPHGLVPGSR